MEFETVLEQTIALVQRQGKRNEARQLLAEVYDWFTEGLDTAVCKRRRPCWRSWLDMQRRRWGMVSRV